MNLKQLTYFVTLAEELHFGRAAERLGMAQPPLSRQIKQFEDELEAVLFNRGHRAITLTQAGERLLERGQAILRDLEDTRLEVRRIGQGAAGRLRVGFVGSATFGILPNIIKSFRAAYPEVAMSLIPMNNAQLYRSLIRREIDVAFARPTLSDKEFLTRKLREEPLIVAVPDTLDTGHHQTCDLGRLTDGNLILYPEFPRPNYADFVLERCKERGLDFKKRVFSQDLQTALSLVAIGEGICIIPESVRSAQRAGIRFLNIMPELGATELSVNYRIDEQGVHVKNFVKLAQAVSKKTF
ncbi:LysR family transcriptional regulator [Paracoccus sp. M683]|uniref:LysR family transcriptional regulator n=1 Tax=Paracoccus sp. M683 TaxID=2594268 RepID=UPI0011813506|nr:LysR family transcriptional regulator [Paracoccus sp. M683]TRW98864.1 LysR family transcriptional regulator [Paracoccus sp. M683]